MPKSKKRQNTGRRRQQISRFRPLPFISNIPGAVFNLKTSGLTTIDFDALFLVPDIKPTTVQRSGYLKFITFRFYPCLYTDPTKPFQLSVQLNFYDVATNATVPVTPIVPLSSTYPVTVRGRNPTVRWSYIPTSTKLCSMSFLSTQTSGAIAVDIQSTFILAPDNAANTSVTVDTEPVDDPDIEVLSQSTTSKITHALAALPSSSQPRRR